MKRIRESLARQDAFAVWDVRDPTKNSHPCAGSADGDALLCENLKQRFFEKALAPMFEIVGLIASSDKDHLGIFDHALDIDRIGFLARIYKQRRDGMSLS